MAPPTITADGSASWGMPGNGASHIPVIGSMSCPPVYKGPYGEKLIDCAPCGNCGECGRRVV